jgi:hypothetical protein
MRNINKITPVSLSVVTMFYFLGSTSSLAMEDVVDEVTHSYMKLKKSHKKAHDFHFNSIKTENNSLFESFASLINSNVTNLVKSFGLLKYKFTDSNLSSFELMKKKENFIGSSYFFNYAQSQGFENTKVNEDIKVNIPKNTEKLEKKIVNIDKLKRDLDNVASKIENEKIADSITIIIGNVGAGKTALYSTILGLPLRGYYNTDEREYLIEGKGISTSKRSETKYPAISEYIVDCPGFGIKGEEEQDIINAYTLHNLFNKVKNFNLLLVVSLPEIESKAEYFINAIDHLEKLFPNKKDINKLKKGLNLVISQGTKDKNDVKFIKTKIRKIEEDRHANLSPFAREMLQFLANEENEKISFFEKPQEEGSIKKNTLFIENKPFIEKLNTGISLARSTEGLIKDSADAVAEKISDFFVEFEEDLPKYTRNFIRAQAKTIAQDTRNSLKKTAKNLSEAALKCKDGEDGEDDIKNLEEILKKFDGETDLSNKFALFMEQREFLKRIKPKNILMNLKVDPLTLKNIAGKLTILGDDHINFYNSKKNNKIKISSYVVGTSDVQKKIDGGLFKAVEVHGWKSIIIDEDITLPGISVALASPFWIVLGKKIVNLKGNNGSNPKPKPKEHGENGVSGSPGQSGGNFYGLVDKIYNPEDLFINTSGGIGGAGQGGGDGKPGKAGKNGDLDVVKNRAIKGDTISDYQPNSWERFFMFLGAPLTDRLEYISGEKGEKGEDSGAGGHGGQGGYRGVIEFVTFDGQTTPSSYNIKEDRNRIHKRGKDGPHGEHGNPGKGGDHGRVYKGIYCSDGGDKIDKKKTAIWSVVGSIAGGVLSRWLPEVPANWVAWIPPHATAWIPPHVKAWIPPTGIAGLGAFIGSYIPKVANTTINGGWQTEPKERNLPKKEDDGKEPLYHTPVQQLPEQSEEIDLNKIRSKWNIDKSNL